MRAYSVGDMEVAFDRGDLTPAEQQLEIDFDLEAEGPEFSKENMAAWREWQRKRIDEEMVMRIASLWSINPLTLDERELPQGWIGVYRR